MLVYSSNGRFEVTTVEPRSYRWRNTSKRCEVSGARRNCPRRSHLPSISRSLGEDVVAKFVVIGSSARLDLIQLRRSEKPAQDDDGGLLQ